MIVGIDEVGRGCWAGPMVVGAVAWEGVPEVKLDDSKKLSAKRRVELARYIKQHAAGIGLGWVSAQQIDNLGLGPALKLAAQRAMRQLHVPYDEIIIDGTVNLLGEGHTVTLLKKADSLIPAVSAASIVAKVARDSYMTVVEQRFPGYGFARHVGYGTAAHAQALASFGPCALHRMSFAPLAEYRPEQSHGPTVISARSGQLAEDAATAYLEADGYAIIARNWKTKYCEIDIVAQKGGQIAFVEVKYRKNNLAGQGMDYITPRKQQQMSFAAEMWCHRYHPADSMETVLAALEVSGPQFAVTQFLPELLVVARR